MAISIDWGTSVINVPKADLTLIQEVPTEIRELNLNWFRLQLKDLEDSDDGMPFQKTHNHNTEVNLGGLTFARVIEILIPYTVTFEDGQYAVNLVGANSNVGDRVNVNQVSVRSSNSAGLISTPLMEFSSFEGGVWWDPENVTGVAGYGTLFPLGTRLKPTRNLTDVKTIADYRGFNVIYVMGDVTINTTLDFTRFIFEGQTHVNNIASISAGVNVLNTVFRDLTISGTLDGGNEVTRCTINDLDYVNGHIHDCGLEGAINLAGGSDSILADCSTLDPYNPPVIDMGGSGQNLIMPNYVGLLTVKNLSGNNFIGIGLNAGTIILENTIISGTVQVIGIGKLQDENGDEIPTGTWNGGVTIINDLINKDNIAVAVWDEQLAKHLNIGTTGFAMMQRVFQETVYIDVINGSAGTEYPHGTVQHPVDNIGDALTLAVKYNLKNLYIIGDIELTGITLTGYVIKSLRSFGNTVTLSNSILTNVLFSNISVTGTMISPNDSVQFEDCYLFDIINLVGEAFNCRLEGTNLIKMGSIFSGVGFVMEGDFTTMDLRDASGTTFSADIDSGYVFIQNMVTGCLLEVNLRGGELELDEVTITGGDFYAEGYGTLIGDPEALGMDIKANHLLALETIPSFVWSSILEDMTTDGSIGLSVMEILKLTGYDVQKVGSVITIMEEDGITPWRQYDLENGNRIQL